MLIISLSMVGWKDRSNNGSNYESDVIVKAPCPSYGQMLVHGRLFFWPTIRPTVSFPAAPPGSTTYVPRSRQLSFEAFLRVRVPYSRRPAFLSQNVHIRTFRRVSVVADDDHQFLAMLKSSAGTVSTLRQ